MEFYTSNYRTDQHFMLQAAGSRPGRYTFYFRSSVQAPCTQYNAFHGLVVLDDRTWIEISTSGRNHGGQVSVQLFLPGMQAPCGAERWRTAAAALPLPPPTERGCILAVRASSGNDHLELETMLMQACGSGTSNELGIQLELSMHGKHASGTAQLRRGLELPPGSAACRRCTFQLA